MRYNAIPSVIYSNPEVAFVGIGQQQAALQGIMVEEINLPLRYSGRYMAEVEDGNGICKIVVDKKTHRLLGVHMIGRYVSEIIYGAAFMIESEYLITDLQEIVFPHPTIGEVLRETFFMYKGGYGRKLSDLKDGK
jgi:dihydrolipoamide dehydrogenase